jgi:hypothetical protein
MLSVLSTQAHEGGTNPWLVGGVTLAILIVMIAGLLMFGAGREHS